MTWQAVDTSLSTPGERAYGAQGQQSGGALTCIKKFKLSAIYRKNTPEPFWQTFRVPYDETTSVLDALNYIKEELDSTVSFRWSCRMAICGSCGYMVNGIPKLGCKDFVRNYPSALRIEPLAHFTVERDLMVAMDEFLQHLEAVKPYLIAEPSEPHKPHRQTPAQLAKYKQFANCINCGLCYAACPQFGLNPEFVGPRCYRFGTSIQPRQS